MTWLCKIISENTSPIVAQIEADNKIALQKITKIVETGIEEFQTKNYESAEKHLLEALELFEPLDPEDYSGMKSQFYLILIGIAEELKDYPKLIKYCSLAINSRAGCSISILEIRGRAYLEIGEIEKAQEDFQEHNHWLNVYGAVGAQTELEMMIEDLIAELFDYYCLYLGDKKIAEIIFRAIENLVDFWDVLN